MFRRFIISLLLIAAVGTAVSAQPAPSRGAYSLGAPYAVPGGVQTRGAVFVVNTTVDEHIKDPGFCDPNEGTGLSFREAVQTCANINTTATIYVPSGVYHVEDDLDVQNFVSVTIIGEDPLTTIIDNAKNDLPPEERSAGHGMTLWVINGNSISVSNLTFRDSDGRLSTSNFNGGGMLIVGSGGTVTLNNLIFKNNVGLFGGGISIEEGPMNVTASHLTVTGNIASGGGAGGGGGLYFLAGAPASSLTVLNSVFSGNTAVQGGGLYLDSVDSVVLNNVSVLKNIATGVFTDDGTANDFDGMGGGLMLNGSTATIINSDIALNTAGDPIHDGYGGGVLVAGVDMTLLDSTIQDNGFVADGVGPECYTAGAQVSSEGMNSITTTDGCTFIVRATDRYNNLVTNGSFEKQGKKGKPSSATWDIKSVEGTGARVCNKPNKAPVSESGMCSLALGGGGGAGKISQKIDLTDVTFQPGDVLVLAGKTKRKTGSTVTLTATATFSDGTSKVVIKFTSGGVEHMDDWQTQSESSPQFLTGAVKKITVELKSSKLAYFDDVYLYVDTLAPRSATPTGLRGNN